ncbi:hypothetical protein [Aneurinibacillus sp. REN35]|uniref:hypothetical protein n=1 Tax=Aneurinibacillus sp. REN35 TaxID=3237286 RepID=UPI003526D2C0
MVIEEIVKRAKKEKKKVERKGMNKSEKLKDIRINRQGEKIVNQQKEKFDLTLNGEEKKAEVISIETREKANEFKYSTNSRLMEKLRKKRDEGFEKE